MAAMLKVASSEHPQAVMSSLGCSPLASCAEPSLPMLFIGPSAIRAMGPGSMVASARPEGKAAELATAGVHGVEVTEGALLLPQLIAHSANKPHPPAMHLQSASSATRPSVLGTSGAGDGPEVAQQGTAQHAFITGGLGALGQLLALWLHHGDTMNALSLVGRSGRADANAGGSFEGQLPMWAQCLQSHQHACPMIQLVRCDTAAWEESAGALKSSGLDRAMQPVDCIFHAGTHTSTLTIALIKYSTKVHHHIFCCACHL